MSRIKIKIIAGLLFLLANVHFGYGQRLCVCFDADTPYLEYSFSKDSLSIIFGVTVKGYETEEKRQKAWAAYKERPTNYPVFITNYVAKDPEKIKSLEEVDCKLTVGYEDFRQHTYSKKERVGRSIVIFLEKLPDGTFIKWNAVHLN